MKKTRAIYWKRLKLLIKRAQSLQQTARPPFDVGKIKEGVSGRREKTLGRMAAQPTADPP